MPPVISAEERYPKRFIDVRGVRMAYVDEGAGDPIVLVHGNQSSSYQWRNVIPQQQHRTVRAGHFVPEDAPDEVGAAIAGWLRSLPEAT